MIPALDDLHAALANETDRQNQGILLPLDPALITKAQSELAAIRHRLANMSLMSSDREVLEDDRDNLQTALDDLQRVRDGKIKEIACCESRSITSLFPRELELFDRIREAWRISGKKGWGASA